MKGTHLDRDGESLPAARGIVAAVVLGIGLGLLVLVVATRVGSAIGG